MLLALTAGSWLVRSQDWRRAYANGVPRGICQMGARPGGGRAPRGSLRDVPDAVLANGTATSRSGWTSPGRVAWQPHGSGLWRHVDLRASIHEPRRPMQ